MTEGNCYSGHNIGVGGLRYREEHMKEANTQQKKKIPFPWEMTKCSQWHHVRGHRFHSPHLWFRQQKVPNTPVPASLVLLPVYSLFNHFYILSVLSSFPHVSSSLIHCALIFRKKKANLHFCLPILPLTRGVSGFVVFCFSRFWLCVLFWDDPRKNSVACWDTTERKPGGERH